MKTSSIFSAMLIALLFFSCSDDDVQIVPNPVFEGERVISSQSELELFASNNYTSVTGHLDITGSVTSLALLDGLTSISSMRIQNARFLNEVSLDNLEEIEFLTVSGNEQLRSISLDGLTSAGEIILTSNENLREFSMTNLTSIESLVIFDFQGSSLGLASLESVEEDLILERMDQLADLESLSQLTSVGGEFGIRDISLLRSMSGLQNLASVGGSLNVFFRTQISSNIQLDFDLPKLTSLGSLYIADYYMRELSVPSLEFVTNEISLWSMRGLETIRFESLETLGALSLPEGAVTENSSSISISFPELTSLGGALGALDIQIPSVETIDFPKLATIEGHLLIGKNEVITTLDGFPLLESISGFMRIADNASLESIEGFENLQSVGSIEIQDNSSLNQYCGLLNVVNSGNFNSLTIESNFVDATLDDLMNGDCVF